MAARKKDDEVQVLIPYSRLVELLEAAGQIEDLRKTNRNLLEQMAALRFQFAELMEQFRLIQD